MAKKFKGLDESRKYLNDIVEGWTKSGATHNIIDLANNVFKTETTKDYGSKSKMKILFTNINQLKAIIKRNKDLDLPTKAYEKDLKLQENRLSELEAKHGKYIPPKYNKKVKK